MATITVSVPATSANLGPGFDSLGLAIGLYNTIEIAPTTGVLVVEITGEGAGTAPTDDTNLIVKAAYAVFKRVDLHPDGLYFKLTNAIPLASGLGSSAAALIGGMVAANMLLDEPLEPGEILALALQTEGHPDNLCPALLGGLVVSSYVDHCLTYCRLPVAPMKVIVALPAIEGHHTQAMRALLPGSVPLKDAAANIGRAILVTRALAEGDYDLLADAMQDRLHEPYRRPAIPGIDQAAGAALEAGATAVTLSGSGPSLIAFAPAQHEQIGDSMAQAFQAATGQKARVWVLPIDTQGTVIRRGSRHLALRHRENLYRATRIDCP
ncbi:MAG: homoserine kinase [Anaerolineae bacterium]|nr:homoserine kinase [Anaerolineae bacterium]